MKPSKKQIDDVAVMAGITPEKVVEIINDLEKVGLDVLPAGAVTRPRREVEITMVEQFIKEFIEKKVLKPVGLVGVFPYQQLARDIVSEFSIK